MRRFINGLITGGIIGAVLGSLFIPHKKPVSTRIKGKVKRFQGADDLMRK
jgi:gas vesicle protein